VAHTFEVAEQRTPVQPGRKPPRFGLGADGTSSPAGLIAKIVVLGLVAAIAVWAAFPLIDKKNWIGLAILVLVTALVFFVYLSKRYIPAKYLVPGTLFLIVFQIIPVLYTVSTAFTNFGDAHRGTKQEAIQAVEGASVKPVPGSAAYTLTLATDGSVDTGNIVFLLTDPATKKAFLGTSKGLSELPAGKYQQAPTGKITSADGYTLLSVRQANARSDDLSKFSVPTDRGPSRARDCRAPSRELRCRRTTPVATASRTPGPARPGPRTTRTASSSATGRTWLRAGRSTSACATSPGC